MIAVKRIWTHGTNHQEARSAWSMDGAAALERS